MRRLREERCFALVRPILVTLMRLVADHPNNARRLLQHEQSSVFLRAGMARGGDFEAQARSLLGPNRSDCIISWHVVVMPD